MPPRKRTIKKGLSFTVAVCGKLTFLFARSPSFHPAKMMYVRSRGRIGTSGQSGTGRTTFVNTLCESEVIPHRAVSDPSVAHMEDGIKIKPVTVGE